MEGGVTSIGIKTINLMMHLMRYLKKKIYSEISQIKAPRELVDRTKLEMRAELGKKVQPSLFDKRIKVKFSYRLIIFSGSIFTSDWI